MHCLLDHPNFENREGLTKQDFECLWIAERPLIQDPVDAKLEIPVGRTGLNECLCC